MVSTVKTTRLTFSSLYVALENADNCFEAGATFDNSFFNNCFGFLRQFKNRSFLGIFTVHKKVKIRINRSKTGQHLTLINVLFDFFPTLYWSKKTVEVNQFWIVEEYPVERSTCSQLLDSVNHFSLFTNSVNHSAQIQLITYWIFQKGSSNCVEQSYVVQLCVEQLCVEQSCVEQLQFEQFTPTPNNTKKAKRTPCVYLRTVKRIWRKRHRLKLCIWVK